MAGPFQPSLVGTLIEWDAQRGFGFLQVGEERVFIHWRGFVLPTPRNPGVGDRVQFTLGFDEQGRPCAKEAAILLPEPAKPKRQGSNGLRVVLVAWPLLLFLPVKAALWHGVPAQWVAIYAVGINAITYFLYKTDKRRAQENEWRVPERMLHAFELIGGWPGALLAQRRFRHKTAKFDYRFWFWLIVIAYQFTAYDSMQHWRWSKAIGQHFDREAQHHR